MNRDVLPESSTYLQVHPCVLALCKLGSESLGTVLVHMPIAHKNEIL